ncbi:MAG: TetR/AcrR family transcriptional regulator [Pseudomonadota bacterium]
MAPAPNRQLPDFEPKKRPRQERAQVTYESLVEACARLLPVRGYAGVTTNHVAEAAGVGIASLYEYFPGKDALVAEVAARLVSRVMAALAAAMTQAIASPPERAVRLWISAIHDTLRQERELVEVFVYQVPYTNRLPVIRGLTPLLLQFTQAARARVADRVQIDPSPASLLLLNNLVVSTILQLVLEPPENVPEEDVLEALSRRVQQWLEGG